MGDGQQVQYRVGGTFQGDHRGNGVLEGFHAEDIRRLDTAIDQVQHGGAGRVTVGAFVVGDRFLGG